MFYWDPTSPNVTINDASNSLQLGFFPGEHGLAQFLVLECPLPCVAGEEELPQVTL